MSVEETAAKVAAGTVAGVVSGVVNGAAPHIRRVGSMGAGAFNIPSTFFNATTKSLRTHHKVGTALSAGAAAVVGHGVIATAATAVAAGAVAAAPFVLGAAAVGGAVVGTVKLFEHLRKKA